MADFTVKSLDRRRQAMLWPLAALVKLWGRSIRIEMSAEEAAMLRDSSEPTILLLWHNRLFLSGEVYRRYRHPNRIWALVSASRDGAWLAAFIRLLGAAVVRGSSSRGGREAMSDLANRLRDGDDIAITPDGPRGPAYSFKPGAAILARRTQTRVLLLGMSFESAWRLKSWDRFILPRPGSRVRFRCSFIPPGELPDSFEETVNMLRRRLEELNF